MKLNRINTWIALKIREYGYENVKRTLVVIIGCCLGALIYYYHVRKPKVTAPVVETDPDLDAEEWDEYWDKYYDMMDDMYDAFYISDRFDDIYDNFKYGDKTKAQKRFENEYLSWEGQVFKNMHAEPSFDGERVEIFISHVKKDGTRMKWKVDERESKGMRRLRTAKRREKFFKKVRKGFRGLEEEPKEAESTLKGIHMNLQEQLRVTKQEYRDLFKTEVPRMKVPRTIKEPDARTKFVIAELRKKINIKNNKNRYNIESAPDCPDCGSKLYTDEKGDYCRNCEYQTSVESVLPYNPPATLPHYMNVPYLVKHDETAFRGCVKIGDKYLTSAHPDYEATRFDIRLYQGSKEVSKSVADQVAQFPNQDLKVLKLDKQFEGVKSLTPRKPKEGDACQIIWKKWGETKFNLSTVHCIVTGKQIGRAHV